jgi:hypothetical protein
MEEFNKAIDEIADSEPLGKEFDAIIKQGRIGREMRQLEIKFIDTPLVLR